MTRELAIKNQFSKFASQYNNNNIIQQIVSKALVREIKDKPKRILELGCGPGQIFKNIDFDFDYYKAIDFSQEMCDIHPTNSKLDIFCLNFDSDQFFDNIKDEQYDLVLSSSALQWSKDLSKIVNALAQISDEINMVLFTSNTFKTIFELTNSKSPILELESIKDIFSMFYNSTFEVLEYKLEFETKKELFSYIKNSGVSGETNNLSFKKAKHLYKNYDKSYLEFEVVFIKGNTKK
ncbi:MAG: methyltransferase domain-containing protein [Campylobacterota bacterium]|nr:methyltransferase domain-containing protein [Campylobacterota bacterium]